MLAQPAARCYATGCQGVNPWQPYRYLSPPMPYQVYMRHRVRPHIIKLTLDECSLYMAQRVAQAKQPDYLVTRILSTNEQPND